MEFSDKWQLERFQDECLMDGRCQIMDIDRLQRIVENAPLNERAWVFQERLLSPRVIHFGREQIVWECEHKRACETYPDEALDGTADAVKWSHFWPMKNFARKLLTGGEIVLPGAKKNAYLDWRLFVELYSYLYLTYANDSFIALSGLAKTMQKAIGDEYLAGLWKGDLVHGLLWERKWEYEYRNTRTSPEWIAPSWSWASTGCSVTWDDFQWFASDIHIALLDSHIIGKMSDTTGQLQEARLRLKARIFEVLCTQNKHFAVGWQTHRNSKILEVVLNWNIYGGFLTFDSPEGQMQYFHLRSWMPSSYGKLSFMPVAFSPIEAYGGTRWYGLVLSPCDEPNHYRRIGRLEIQIPTADVTDILRNVDEGLQPRLVHPELYWLYMMQRMTRITSSSPNGEASHSPVDGREREIELV